MEPRLFEVRHLRQLILIETLQVGLDLGAAFTLDGAFFLAKLGLLFVVDDAGEDVLDLEEFLVDGILFLQSLLDALELLV